MNCDNNDKRFCVYFHACKITGNIMYIGSGTIKRANNFITRTAKHKNYANTLNVVIVKENLSLTEARLEENRLLEDLWNPSMFNKQNRVNFIKEIKYSEISKFCYYDETSPSKIRKVKTNNPVGVAKTNSISINKETYVLSRIVYCLYYKTDIDPNLVVKFVDNNPLNFLGNNLLLSTKEYSSRSLSKLDKRNSSGVTGVWWDEKNLSWRTCYGVQNKVKTKYFSTKPYTKNGLSLEDAKAITFEQAVKYREKIEEEVLGI